MKQSQLCCRPQSRREPVILEKPQAQGPLGRPTPRPGHFRDVPCSQTSPCPVWVTPWEAVRARPCAGGSDAERASPIRTTWPWAGRVAPVSSATRWGGLTRAGSDPCRRHRRCFSMEEEETGRSGVTPTDETVLSQGRSRPRDVCRCVRALCSWRALPASLAFGGWRPEIQDSTSSHP